MPLDAVERQLPRLRRTEVHASSSGRRIQQVRMISLFGRQPVGPDFAFL